MLDQILHKVRNMVSVTNPNSKSVRASESDQDSVEDNANNFKHVNSVKKNNKISKCF